jgi:hypothetical protein
MQELKREGGDLNTDQLICNEIGELDQNNQPNRLRYRRKFKSVLVYQGYSFTPGDEIYVPNSLQSSLQGLLSDSLTLPKDKYCPEQTRYRRHSRLILLPWEKKLLAWPKNGYFQDSQINVDDGGVVREFEPLSAAMLDNAFLQELIFADFNQSPFQASDLLQPFDVGIHVIKTVPRREEAAVASPNRLHKDTEPFTFIHLLARENVVGGENIVADNTKEPLFIGTLTNTMDTLVVQDASVFHHVMPIKLVDEGLPGFRTVLLIDFTPMKSAVNQY